MANPLEDQIYEYVMARRPLKLMLLATTAVAIASSAVSTLRPAVDVLRPVIVKGLGVKAPQSAYLRYQCIASRVAASTKIIDQFPELEKEPSDSVRSSLLLMLGTLEHCQTLLGVPQFVALADTLRTASVPELLGQAQQTLTRNDDFLAAHLARTNIAEYNLLNFFHYLHEAISFSDYLLNHSQSGVASETAVKTLKQRAKSANESYRRFASLSEYSVPQSTELKRIRVELHA